MYRRSQLGYIHDRANSPQSLAELCHGQHQFLTEFTSGASRRSLVFAKMGAGKTTVGNLAAGWWLLRNLSHRVPSNESPGTGLPWEKWNGTSWICGYDEFFFRNTAQLPRFSRRILVRSFPLTNLGGRPRRDSSFVDLGCIR